jgi:sulfate permease, SulP family
VSCRYLAPRFPAALVVVVLAIVASSALDLAAHGVATVGSIPSGLPAVGLPRAPLQALAFNPKEGNGRDERR